MRRFVRPSSLDLGDLYLHETVISHIRRLLMEKFVCLRIGETFPQFKRRMQKVQDYMNSEDFRQKPDGDGLFGLAKQLLPRCEELRRKRGSACPSDWPRCC